MVDKYGREIFAAAEAGLDVPIPSCPGWDMAKLVTHIGRVYTTVAAHVRERATELLPPDHLAKPPEDQSQLLEWYEAALDDVNQALKGVEPDEPLWSFASQKDGAFWMRRQAHESIIHAWDATNAAGQAVEIAGDIGADGVDEYLTVILEVNFGNHPDLSRPSGSLHYHRTDGEGEWFCEMTDSGELSVKREHSKGDAAIQGSGSDLMLAVWGRLDLNSDRLAFFGDEAAAAEWQAFSR